DHVTKMRLINRTKIFHFDIGPSLNYRVERLRLLKVRILAQDRQLDSSLSCHRIERHFVSPGARLFQYFGKTAFGLQTNGSIHFRTSKIQDRLQAVELCSSRLTNTPADDVTQSRFTDAHIRVITQPRQPFAFGDYVFVVQPKKFHCTHY